ncbi:DNA-binding transcriptional regulator YhcF, GntR family [Kytococcus aerolatus]|uniref:DNA-binding transcriptional regulator YhcF, GntR family n=1 Tax=Kytococcus aerolatus TaxID=592308 RepID=A0A212TER8_9MICO|nr:GntR family transcriptional regulator [Kytococcus aerolatus]SNC64522.1 DNA-binding transcriptional regulator YhcF, GntR family [Kytococcus aerolatus]
MLWHLDPTDDRPLFTQVADTVHRGVEEGDLAPGDRLPAARELAELLEVNVHTVLRGYRQLADEGLIDLRRGRGAVVLVGAERAGTARLAALAAEFVTECRRLGVSHEGAVRLVQGARVA